MRRPWCKMGLCYSAVVVFCLHFNNKQHIASCFRTKNAFIVLGGGLAGLASEHLYSNIIVLLLLLF